MKKALQMILDVSNSIERDSMVIAGIPISSFNDRNVSGCHNF